ncbi:hypothetical protein FRC08_000906 [Ceratobasidium sp. 394]|nr:hypothetical protein FRC08_000906 [Ceratobasidium sp. 394]
MAITTSPPQLEFPGCRCSQPVLGKTAFNRRSYRKHAHVCSVRPSSHTRLPCIYHVLSPHYIELRASAKIYKPKQPSSCEDSPQTTMTGFVAMLDSQPRPATADGRA